VTTLERFLSRARAHLGSLEQRRCCVLVEANRLRHETGELPLLEEADRLAARIASIRASIRAVEGSSDSLQ
jgi:hypothetical protein